MGQINQTGIVIYNTNSYTGKLAADFNGVGMAKFQFDFAVDGGAVGTIFLRDMNGVRAVLPADLIINGEFIVVSSVPMASAGGTATISFDLAAPGDLKAATAEGAYAALEISAVPTPFVTVGFVTPTLTVAVEDLTAGVLEVYIPCVG